MNQTKIVKLNTSADPRNGQSANAKVSKEDWLQVALDILISDGVGEVKVLPIGERLGVSRSSFYWYFKSRQDLLDALLRHWEATNTAALIGQSELPAETITEAVCNVFRCAVNPTLFDDALDFAVRDWARRSGKVRKILDRSDQQRVSALHDMFARFGYRDIEALTRARILYFMQLGYNVAELNESLEDRLKLISEYIFGFTGQRASVQEINAFVEYARQVYRE